VSAPGRAHVLRDRAAEVPAFHVLELAPKRSRFAVCVPVIDEGERIARQLECMRETARGIDVVIADGGSTDGYLGEERLRAAGVRALLTKTGPGRLSAQMRMAIAWGLEQGYEGFVFVDGNGKDDTAAIPRFVEMLESGFDHVQGSRYVTGGRGVNTPFVRHVAVRCVHAPLVSLAAGYWYTDTTNGFRAYSARFLADPRVQPLRDVFTGYELHYYLAIRAARLAFRVFEVPVTRTYPSGERVPTKISPLRGNLRVLGALLGAVLQRYNPKHVP
jgi:glycosyltransferase involved in cell wall biosynthesis